MSELINNSEVRKQAIKDILKKLHEGKSLEEVKEDFNKAFSKVSASEISEAEQALIKEGMEVSEIQKLCDVHAAVFKGSVLEIHKPKDVSEVPGHPANMLKLENREIERILENRLKPKKESNLSESDMQDLKGALEELGKIHIHYLKKENLIFPIMEKKGIEAPPKVMWAVDDEIRALIKDLKLKLQGKTEDLNIYKEKLTVLYDKINEMIFKEENILLPMIIESFSQGDWKAIHEESREIGFIAENIPEWKPSLQLGSKSQEEKKETKGIISLPTGNFTLKELTAVLNTLPFDITFVDKEDTVRYFSEGKERIFTRTKAAIGRKVVNCHPPASVHIVEQIVEDLRTGRKDNEDFWINLGSKFALIRYFAVRDEMGEFLGVLEVSQDIKPIQEITGEKRLASR
ncbi:DUF438 domain-containing protein [Clostridium polynesiense]|uniref:DUF438 domain-containing protein n=1 Tax=Clostridium polynesiense TaxID=1325933 RepID=UPI00058EBD91|nr:DUF438 domain-containing protein [Clostridium polynesiense]